MFTELAQEMQKAVLGSQFSVLSSQFSVLSSQFSVLSCENESGPDRIRPAVLGLHTVSCLLLD